jgi:predicted DNA-binding protein YlxM (UPF0122 family)
MCKDFKEATLSMSEIAEKNPILSQSLITVIEICMGIKGLKKFQSKKSGALTFKNFSPEKKDESVLSSFRRMTTSTNTATEISVDVDEEIAETEWVLVIIDTIRKNIQNSMEEHPTSLFSISPLFKVFDQVSHYSITNVFQSLMNAIIC